MAADGLDPAILDMVDPTTGAYNGPPPFAGAAAAAVPPPPPPPPPPPSEPPSAAGAAVPEEYAKYFKMLKMHLPRG